MNHSEAQSEAAHCSLAAGRGTIEGGSGDAVPSHAQRLEVLEGGHLVEVEGAGGEGHQEEAAAPVQIHS